MSSVEWLLDHGAKPDGAPAAPWTPLTMAAFHGHPEAVRALFGRGAAVDKRTTATWNALHMAAANSHGDIVRSLA